MVTVSLAAAALAILAFFIWQVSEADRRNHTAPVVQAPAPAQDAPPERGPQQSPEEERAGTGGGVEGQPAERPAPPQTSRREDEQRVAGQQPHKQPRQHARAPRPGEQTRSLVITVLLLPVPVVRENGQAKVVNVSSRVGTVNLQLPLVGEDEVYSFYKATLRAGGKDVRSWTNLKPAVPRSDSYVQVPVPAKLLHNERYEITLAGLAAGGRAEELRTYSFQVKEE